MRQFRDPLEMVKEVERELFEMGIDSHPASMQDKEVATDPGFATKELLGYSYGLSSFRDLDNIFKHFPNIDNPLGYCFQEKADRLGSLPLNPGNAYKARLKLWSRFLEEDGRFSYSYSERMYGQVLRAIRLLDSQADSRQVIISIYDKDKDHENAGGVRRIPCSMYYQLLLRNVGGRKCLSLIYTMRSCDYYNHFPIDAWLAINLLTYVAECLGAEPTNFIHFMGSLHAYAKDYQDRRVF